MSKIHVPKFIQNLLNEISKKNGFNNYSMKFEKGSRPGDGFTSNIIRVTISEQESQKNMSLVYKIAPENENRRKEFNSDLTFTNEAYFYNKLMPIFAKFQEEKCLPLEKRFVSFPKCYAAVTDDEKQEYALVLEDLRLRGFRMWDKSKPSPVENVRLAMREIGKFHGISIAMIDQRPEVFAPFKRLSDLSKKFMESKNMLQMFDSAFERTISLLKSEDHKTVYREIRTNFKAYLENCVGEEASALLGVMSHGDFWTNNCFYQFKENMDVAEDIRIIDWQTLRYASPAIDVIFNLFISTDRRLRDKEFDNLVRLYYETLSDTVKLLGSNPNELFTFDYLQKELKRLGYYILLVAPVYMQVSHAGTSELANLDEMCDSMALGEKQQEMITGLNVNGRLAYEQRINDIVGDIIRMGYFTKLE